MPAIAVFTIHPELLPAAHALAETLKLPFNDQAEYLLILTPEYLGLQKAHDKSLPLYIDFSSGKMNYRRQHLSIRKEALARALGLKKQTQPTIIDATAGLARDSFIIAALGFDVTLIERSPIIHALIQNGIERAGKIKELADIVQHMHLIHADAGSYLMSIPAPDIIYLDPMFPERKKSALSKIDMRIFHEIVGPDPDADALFNIALSCAKQRVVVKRPRLAPELANKKPSFSLAGSSCRFDIYLA